MTNQFIVNDMYIVNFRPLSPNSQLAMFNTFSLCLMFINADAVKHSNLKPETKNSVKNINIRIAQMNYLDENVRFSVARVV